MSVNLDIKTKSLEEAEEALSKLKEIKEANPREMINTNIEIDLRGRVSVKEKGDRIEEIAKPLIEYLRDSYHPYTSIVITPERVAVIETIQSIPEECIR